LFSPIQQSSNRVDHSPSVAITGIGAITPAGLTPEALWRLTLASGTFVDSGLGRLEEGLLHLPRLRERLAGAEAVSTERGALTGNRTFHRVWRGNVALVGDASGTVDAITGEGLGLAFSQAVALAECFESGNLAHYQSEHRRLALRPLWMARLMLALDGRPRLQHRTLQAFQKRPDIFRRFLELHVGSRSPKHLALDGLSLGWGLLTA